MKHILILSSMLFVAGCTTNAMYSPDAPRQDARAVNYEQGMSINMGRVHIDDKGYIHSMYEPVVHCHTLYYPGKKPERICRLVR